MTTTTAHPSREGRATDLWDGLDDEILACLDAGVPASPAEIGRRLGFSEAAAASCLSMLASEGKVRICLVERVRAAAARA